MPLTEAEELELLELEEEEARAKAQAKPPAAQAPAPTIGQNIAADLKNHGQTMLENARRFYDSKTGEMKTSPLEYVLQQTGEVAGSVNDVANRAIFEPALKKATQTIKAIPAPVRKFATGTMTRLIPGAAPVVTGAKILSKIPGIIPQPIKEKATTTITPAIADIGKKVAEIAKKNPNLVEDVKAGLNIAMSGVEGLGGAFAGKGVKLGTNAIENAFKRAIARRGGQAIPGAVPAVDIAPILEQITSRIDPQLQAIPTPDGGLMRLKDMTLQDAQKLVDEAVADPAVAAQIGLQNIEKAKSDVINSLKEEMVQLRRDISKQPLTKKEIEQSRAGKFNELLQNEGAPATAPKIEKPGLSGWGRLVEDRTLKTFSDKQAEATPDFDVLVDMARQYRIDRSAPNPLITAGEASLGKAFKNFDSRIKDLADAKEQLLQSSSAQIDIRDLKAAWVDAVRKVARAEIGTKQVKDEMGNIVTTRALTNPKGGNKIDPDSDAALIEITNALMDAPDILSAKHADDLKRFIQHRRYSSVGMIPDIADRLSGDFASRLNKQLQTDLGDRYKVINQHLRDYISLEEVLARVLGKPIDVEQGIHRNIAAVMKNAPDSITRTDWQQLFKKVKELSNGKYDPQQAAEYASAAMKVVGDTPAYHYMDAPNVAKIKGEMPKTWFEALSKGILAGPKAIGKAASGGKDDADFLVDYWRKAQGRTGPAGPGEPGGWTPSPNEPINPAGPMAKLLESPRFDKPTIEAIGTLARVRPASAINDRQFVPAGPDVAADPFWNLERATKANSPEAIAKANAEFNTAAGKEPEFFNPPDQALAMTPDEEAGYANAMLRAKPAENVSQQAGAQLRQELFPSVKGDIKRELVPEKKLTRLERIAENINSMHDNDYPQWMEAYGKRGYPDKSDLSADDLIQWMNESGRTQKPRGEREGFFWNEVREGVDKSGNYVYNKGYGQDISNAGRKNLYPDELQEPAGGTRGNVDPAKGIQTEIPFAQEVKTNEPKLFRTSKDVILKKVSAPAQILTAEHAAAAAAPIISRRQRETVLVILTDKNNRPVGISEHAIGLKNQSSVDPAEILGTVDIDKRATGAWLVHNHPAGSTVLSGASGDRGLFDKLFRAAEGTGIEIKDMVAITPQGTATSIKFPEFKVPTLPIESKKIGLRGVREFEAYSPDAKKILSKEDALSAYDNVKNFDKETGIALLDSRNGMVAWVPMKIGEMSLLRTAKKGTGASMIRKYITESGASGMIAFVDNGGKEAAKNLKMFGESISAKLVDAIDLSTKESHRVSVDWDRITGEGFKALPLSAGTAGLGALATMKSRRE